MDKWNFLKWDDALEEVRLSIGKKSEKIYRLCRGMPVVILRDWKGSITICLPFSRLDFQKASLAEWCQELSSSLGLLARGDDISLCYDELFDPDDIWKSPNLVPIAGIKKLSLAIIDRQDKGGDWLKKIPQDSSISTTPRAIFFGVKGGVGRSSALTALAIHLANTGKTVLIIDADFESPGVSSSLLSGKPDFGLVDWLTAQALGASEEILRDLAGKMLVETSPLSQLTQGRILVAPSHANLTQAYISKLGRIYRPTENECTFAQRLNTLVCMLEEMHDADVTLIDSRAGIDDTAAAVITQIYPRVVFLFAINTAQTWSAYKILFKHLQVHPSLHTEQDFRSTFRFVSALTPEEVGAYKGYWDTFLQRAYETCLTLYDVDDGSGEPNIFSPAPDDEESPHFAARIMWHEVLRAFDPIHEKGQLAPALMENVFGDFLEKATSVLGDINA